MRGVLLLALLALAPPFAYAQDGPAPPLITTPVEGAVLSDPTPTIAGIAEPAVSVVDVFIDGVLVGRSPTDERGGWAYTLGDHQALADGPHTVSAQAVDVAGNRSVFSLAVSFIVDTKAPDGPPVCVSPTEPIQGRVSQTVTLSASCADPEGLPLQFLWRIVRLPPGSSTVLSDPTQRQVSIFLDVATTPETPYVIEVTATDVVGQSSSAQFTIFASVTDRLSVQLVWDTDRTDLDLHLLDDIGTADRFGPSGLLLPERESRLGNHRRLARQSASEH